MQSTSLWPRLTILVADLLCLRPHGVKRSELCASQAGLPSSMQAGRLHLVTTQARAGAALPSGRQPRAELPFHLSEAKLHPPVVRPGIVARPSLVDRLTGAGLPTVISVVAPAGYGKTTLLAQWAGSRQPRLAWLSADHRDNDPTVLLTYLAVALDRVERISPTVFGALASPGSAQSVLQLLMSALASMRYPVSIVLDHAEAAPPIGNVSTRHHRTSSFPSQPGRKFAIASGTAVLPLPTARLRAEGGIIEVGPRELAMGPGEASSLLSGAGIELAGEESSRPW